MQLYFAPGACSLADHIALNEAGLAFETVKVDLKSHSTQDGRDYSTINPKGYVPALVLDDGRILTENVAILSWIADRAPDLGVAGDMGRYRLLEMLAYVSTELHKAFKPFFSSTADDASKAQAGEIIETRLEFIAGGLKDAYLFGREVSVADAYLFVMLSWAEKYGLSLPSPLPAYAERMRGRPAVRLALQQEGLT
jgi:glutathione S-transferase